MPAPRKIPRIPLNAQVVFSLPNLLKSDTRVIVEGVGLFRLAKRQNPFGVECNKVYFSADKKLLKKLSK